MSLNKSEIREDVWEKLVNYASPDPVFDLDFSSFIPDFSGSEDCVRKIVVDLNLLERAGSIFITPDNSLIKLRETALQLGRSYLMTTYGIKRGFLMLDPSLIPKSQFPFAATLCGSEVYGKPVSLKDLRGLDKKIDVIFTGAAAVTKKGVRLGKGHGYFDVEWGIFTSLGLLAPEVKVVTVVHDCQLVPEEAELEQSEYDTITDYIITPSQILEVKSPLPKPSGINWSSLSKELLSSIPLLQELSKETEATSPAMVA
jgi:5-formyltetrahydrofolate cyclo-ligase